jgi:hypothetical protein
VDLQCRRRDPVVECTKHTKHIMKIKKTAQIPEQYIWTLPVLPECPNPARTLRSYHHLFDTQVITPILRRFRYPVVPLSQQNAGKVARKSKPRLAACSWVFCPPVVGVTLFGASRIFLSLVFPFGAPRTTEE